MIIKKVIVGELATNCYVVADDKSKEALIIDPGDEADKIFQVVRENNFIPRAIVCTHFHPDHTGVAKEIGDKLNIPVYLHKNEAVMFNKRIMALLDMHDLPEINYLDDDSEIKIGEMTFKIIPTPGHSNGGISLYNDKVLFSGDTLFFKEVGRDDLPGGSWQELKASLKKLSELPPDTKVFPGHGRETTIASEIESNPYFEEIK